MGERSAVSVSSIVPLSVSIVTLRTSPAPSASGCFVGQPGLYVGPGCVGSGVGVAGATDGMDGMGSCEAVPPLEAPHAASSTGTASAVAARRR